MIPQLYALNSHSLSDWPEGFGSAVHIKSDLNILFSKEHIY